MKKNRKILICGGVLLATISVPIVIALFRKDNKDNDEINLTLKANLAKINKLFASTKNRADFQLAVEAKTEGEIITLDELGIETPPSLSPRVIISCVVKNVYNVMTGEIVVTVILTIDDKTSMPKDITITAKGFNFTSDLAKIKSMVSKKNKAEIDNFIGLISWKDIDPAKIGIAPPVNLTSGVIAHYKVRMYNTRTGEIFVMVTLTKDGVTSPWKEIIISPPS